MKDSIKQSSALQTDSCIKYAVQFHCEPKKAAAHKVRIRKCDQEEFVERTFWCTKVRVMKQKGFAPVDWCLRAD